MPHRKLFFDIETRKLANELSPQRELGWTLLKQGKGGISAVAVFDSQEDWTYLYDDFNLLELAAHLESADVLIGFRSQEFDIPCIEGHLGRQLNLKEHLDLYEMIREELGKKGIRGQLGEYTLDAICRRTLGRGKIEKGENAPTLARQGRWARLFRYCMDDVRLTRDLYQYIFDEGGIISATGTFLPVPLPDYLRAS